VLSSLAQTASRLGDYPAAANYWQQLASQASVAPRFRVHALMNWIDAATDAGQQINAVAAATTLASAVISSDDYENILDSARHMFLGVESLEPLALTLFSRGEALAREALHKAANTSHAIQILSYLALRQSDLDKDANVLMVWDSLSQRRRESLWSSSIAYWEYIGLVFRAMVSVGRKDDAEALASQVMQDPSTPPEGFSIVGTRYAFYRLDHDNLAGAMKAFSEVLNRAPSSVSTCYAYYWLAIADWKAGNFAGAKSKARAIRQIMGQKLGVEWRRNLVACALCFEADLNAANLTDSDVVSLSVQRSRLGVIRTDLMNYRL
jgi:tetratricopeptide (TPR) repeat protein